MVGVVEVVDMMIFSEYGNSLLCNTWIHDELFNLASGWDYTAVYSSCNYLARWVK